MADTPSNFDPFPELPEPASRADAKEDYARKADATNAAQYKLAKRLNVFVTWLNTLIAWIVATRTAMTVSQDAAAKSVSDAAGQVKLAVDQAGAAKGSADAAARQLASTETVAAAVRAQINLPSLAGQKGKFWQVSDDEKTLQLVPLIVNRVGDVVTSASPPDSTFVLDDTRYLQSALPELYAKVGLVGYDDILNTAKLSYQPVPSTGGSSTSIAMGKDSVVIGAATNGAIYKLGDTGGGTALYSHPSGFSLNMIATDKKGVFVACGYNALFVRSTDNGVTWAPLAISAAGVPAAAASYTYDNIATDGNGTWLATSSTGGAPFLRSTNNGATWSVIAATLSAASFSTQNIRFAFDGNSTWYANYTVGNFSIYKSTNAGLTWTLAGQVANPVASTGYGVSSINMSNVYYANGTLYVSVSASYNVGSVYYTHWTEWSTDGGITWQYAQVYAGQSQTFPTWLSAGNDGTVAFLDSGGGRAQGIWIWKNIGVKGKTPVMTYGNMAGVNSGATTGITTDGYGLWYPIFGYQYKKIAPNYDIKQYFYVPKISDIPAPFNNYVKGKTQ